MKKFLKDLFNGILWVIILCWLVLMFLVGLCNRGLGHHF